MSSEVVSLIGTACVFLIGIINVVISIHNTKQIRKSEKNSAIYNILMQEREKLCKISFTQEYLANMIKSDGGAYLINSFNDVKNSFSYIYPFLKNFDNNRIEKLNRLCVLIMDTSEKSNVDDKEFVAMVKSIINYIQEIKSIYDEYLAKLMH